ncbi:MAG: hypothetical protein ACW99A_01425 [Candidatus Kariarchaeaceae archaeon]
MKQAKMLRSSFIIYLCLFLSLNFPVSGDTIYFFDDFEYTDDISNHGYDIFQNGTGWSPSTADFNPISGARSLQINAQPCGTTFVSKDLDITFSSDLMLSFWVIWWKAHPDWFSGDDWFSGAFRIYFNAGNDSLSLDYGHNGTAKWESERVFDLGVPFPSDTWYYLERNLQTDIDIALANSEASIISFIPDRISKIEFFSYESEEICENFFDDVKISQENADYTEGTPEDESLDDEPGMDQNKIFDLIFYGGIVISMIFGLGYWSFNRQSKKPLNEKIVSDLIQLCGNCGTKTDDMEIFCGNCGTEL